MSLLGAPEHKGIPFRLVYYGAQPPSPRVRALVGLRAFFFSISAGRCRFSFGGRFLGVCGRSRALDGGTTPMALSWARAAALCSWTPLDRSSGTARPATHRVRPGTGIPIVRDCGLLAGAMASRDSLPDRRNTYVYDYMYIYAADFLRDGSDYLTHLTAVLVDICISAVETKQLNYSLEARVRAVQILL